LVALAKRLLLVKAEKLGTAIPSNIAETESTTINSSSVEPDCFIAPPPSVLI
jgi:hypothetical protein